MAPLYTPPSSPSPALQCVLEYFEALNAWDFDRIMACFSDDLEHQILPKSLGKPLMNKTQYAEYFKGAMPIFARFQLVVHEVIEAGNTLTVHASSTGLSVGGVPYTNEYIIIFHLKSDGSASGVPRICSVKEFVNSDTSIRFFTQAAARVGRDGS